MEEMTIEGLMGLTLAELTVRYGNLNGVAEMMRLLAGLEKIEKKAICRHHPGSLDPEARLSKPAKRPSPPCNQLGDQA